MSEHKTLMAATTTDQIEPARRSIVVRFGSLVRTVVTALALGYSLAIAVLAIVWNTVPQLNWPVELTNLFAVLFFTPLVLLVPLALIVRSRWMTLSVVVPIVIFAALFGDRFIPRQLPGSVSGQVLRVATLNLWRYNKHPERAVQAIRAQHADVIALQELSSSTREIIWKELRAEYPYQELLRGERLGMFSRYPITSSGYLSAVRGHWITLAPDGRAIAVVNVHIHHEDLETRRLPGLDWLPVLRDYDSDVQQQQVQALIQELDSAQLPYVLAGDFNLGDRDPAYAELASHLTDAYRTTQIGFGFTYPSQKNIGPIEIGTPLLRLDYIWSAVGIVPRTAWIDCTSGSDHCMLVADVLIRT